jgi:SAM-dependent methyltransferase
VELQDWEQRHSAENRAEPIPFVIQAVRQLNPGKALDVACGTGRHALWLARQGWSVTAVDGSPTAIRILRERAEAVHLGIETRVADLERQEYSIAPDAWDLIVMSLYLQRDLIEPAKLGVKPGGVMVAITLLAEADKPSRHRLRPGELKTYFTGWEILECSEGRTEDSSHSLARIAARRPFLNR